MFSTKRSLLFSAAFFGGLCRIRAFYLGLTLIPLGPLSDGLPLNARQRFVDCSVLSSLCYSCTTFPLCGTVEDPTRVLYSLFLQVTTTLVYLDNRALTSRALPMSLFSLSTQNSLHPSLLHPHCTTHEAPSQALKAVRS